MQFLTGKAISALLTFAILLLLVRLLPLPQYGAYVSFVALLEVGALVSNLGLPWLAARYLPDFRLHALGSVLYSLCGWVVRAMVFVQGLWTALLAMSLSMLMAWAGLASYVEAATAYLGVVFIEGMGRRVRDDVLGPLMQQSAARRSLVARQGLFLLLIGLCVARGGIDLLAVVISELIASMLGLAIALFSLWRHLRKSMDLCGEPGWQAPSRLQMLRASAPMYGVGLLASLHGPPVFLLILQRMLGVEATAAFGFLRSLYQLAVRYLPATLLAGVLRPRLVASQVDGGDIRATADDANLAGKLSLFVLMPLLGFAAVHGELAVALLSGGRFPSTGWLLFGLWLGLVPLSQRALLEAVAVSAGQSNLCMRAAFLGPLSLPLMIGLVLAGAGIAAAVVALVIGNLLFVALILLGLARRLRYPYDGRGLLRMLFAATLAGLVTWAVDLGLPAGLGGRSHAALGAAAAILAFLGCARLVRPFTAAERDRLNRVFRRKVFIW